MKTKMTFHLRYMINDTTHNCTFRAHILQAILAHYTTRKENLGALPCLRLDESMACIHGLSPRDCRQRGCSTLATMAQSDASTSDFSEDSGSTDEDDFSDEVDVLVDGMKSTNLAGNKGM